MTIKSLLSAFLLSASIIAAPCIATAASPEEAAQIKTTLQAYVGTEPGVVEVTPLGNGYTCLLYTSPSPRDS